MNQRWTLNVREFGPIAEGKIEIRPMLFFVGNNNTGKSYAMTLLWGLLALGRELFPDIPQRTQAYRKCEEWLTERLGQENVTVDDAAQELFVEWFNSLLRSQRRTFLEFLLKHPVDAKDIWISNYSRQRPIRIRWKLGARRFSSGEDYVQFPLNPESLPNETERYRMLKYVCWKLLMDGLSSPMYPTVNLTAVRSAREPVYLPAARTGFMLTYRTLVQSLVASEFSFATDDTLAKSQLPFPTMRFLQELLGLGEPTTSRYGDIADMLEREALSGQIQRHGGPIPAYEFLPTGLRHSMPFHVTSSLVSELAPLILFLRSALDYHVLVIEEPEAHLHLDVQRLLVKALVRLVNRGLCVWFTTHSDTLLEQMNHLLKMSSLPPDIRANFQTQFHYADEDVLSPDAVAGYQFTAGASGKTVIAPLSQDSNGFIVPTFSRALMDLLTEATSLHEEGDIQ